MAPELEDGKLNLISDKSDVYSFGKILYWLLSGGKIFSREKHREPQFDLKGKNDDTLLGWNNIYMEHVNRLLDYMIVTEPVSRRDVENIKILSRQTMRLLMEKFTPIDKDIKQPCAYCGQGYYVLRAVKTHGVDQFGVTPVSPCDWRILSCNKCGHVQSFRIDMAEKKEWWNV